VTRVFENLVLCNLSFLVECNAEKSSQGSGRRPSLGLAALSQSGFIPVPRTRLVSCASICQSELDHAGLPECCNMGVLSFLLLLFLCHRQIY